MGKGRRLAVAQHLTVVELFERYRGAEDAALKAHLQVIWLKAQGWRTNEVARCTGFKPDWVRRLVHRASNGREPLLSEAQRQELLTALGKPAPYGPTLTARWVSWAVGSSEIDHLARAEGRKA
jgi:Homeodomain-like domain